MTVVGIYTTTSSSTESSIQYMNTMYTALSVANSIKGTTGKVSNATYSMENPAQADTFVKAANKLVNDADIIFISYLHEYAYSDYLKFIRAYHPKVRVYIIGTKNFGDNSGVFFKI